MYVNIVADEDGWTVVFLFFMRDEIVTIQWKIWRIHKTGSDIVCVLRNSVMCVTKKSRLITNAFQ